MGFHINDKKDSKKGGKAAKGVPGTKSVTKPGAKSSGGGKRIIKTGGARGS